MKKTLSFLLALYILIPRYSYSQSPTNPYSRPFMEISCSPLFGEYRLDTTNKEPFTSIFVPIIKDSLFISEYIIITKSENKYTKKEYNRRLKDYYDYYRSSTYYFEKLAEGLVEFNDFKDIVFLRDNHFNLICTYERCLYFGFNKKNHIYTLTYVVERPRNWFSHQKWEYSESHFFEKIKSIKLLFNKCHI
jgi:hypothetical protein